MANPYTGGLQRGTKQYPNGTNVPKTNPSMNRGIAVGASNKGPTSASKSNATNGPAYQPWAGPVSAGGTSGPMSRASSHSFGKLDTPVKRALAARKGQGTNGPDRLLGGAASRVKPVS